MPQAVSSRLRTWLLCLPPRPGTNPGTGTTYHPMALPIIGPYALPVPGERELDPFANKLGIAQLERGAKHASSCILSPASVSWNQTGKNLFVDKLGIAPIEEGAKRAASCMFSPATGYGSGYEYCPPPYGTAYRRALRTTRTRWVGTKSERISQAGNSSNIKSSKLRIAPIERCCHKRENLTSWE